MRWNFSSRARELSDGDALVLSIPKSGRTWLRTFVSAYYSQKNRQPFSLEITDQRGTGVPRITYSHDRFEHRTKGSAWDKVRGKYLVPRAQTEKPILLLVRDPRDAFASYFVQHTRRTQHSIVSRLTTAAAIRHPRFGIAAMVEVMNRWLREFGPRKNFEIVRYEDLRGDPGKNFERVLRALGESEIDRSAFEQALKFTSFENMRSLEATGGFANKILQPRDSADAESFKVRRGKVGGFRDDLSDEDQAYAARAMRQLDPRFGYEPD